MKLTIERKDVLSTSYKLGKTGEDVACKYLQKEGYTIINRNFRSRFGEIDIVALEENTILVFIEVKTRRTNTYGRPSDSVDYKKKSKLKKTIQFFNAVNNVKGMEQRFDIIEIMLKNRKFYLNHVKACEL